MNIWYFSAYDQPRGHSSRTYDFARMLKNRGHSVSIFTNSICHYTQKDRIKGNIKWLEEEIDGLLITWLKTPPYTNNLQRFNNMFFNAYRALQAGKIRQDRPDIIVGPTVPLFTSWSAQRLAKRYDCPFFLEIRDIWPQTFVDMGKMSTYSPIFYVLRWLEKTLYKTSDTIVSTLPFGAQHVAESGGDPDKVLWIPNGVDLSRFDDVHYSDKKSNKKTHFVYTGSFGSGNYLLPIIDACKLVDMINPFWSLTLVGNGNQRHEIESRIKAYGLKAKISMPGIIEKKEIPEIIRSGDAMMISLRPGNYFRYGCNINKLYDYFAAGRPVIFSGNVPDDHVKKSGAGYSVPAKDADELSKVMLKFMDLSIVQRENLGKRARKYAEENFDVRKLTEILENRMLKSIEKER